MFSFDTPAEFGPNSTLLALEQAARERGYAIASFAHRDAAEDAVAAGIADLMKRGIDALCVIGPRTSTPDTLREISIRMPVVVVGSVAADWLVTVDTDQVGGVRAAIEHLQQLGHRRIAHLAGPLDTAVGSVRMQAWRGAVPQEGKGQPLVVGDWSSESGYSLGASLHLLADATAVFAANDQMALGMIHGLWSRGIRVPEDISVVGFDDMPGSSHFIPPLTTVRQDFAELATVAVSTLLDPLEGTEPVSMRMSAELIVRDSTARTRS